MHECNTYMYIHVIPHAFVSAVEIHMDSVDVSTKYIQCTFSIYMCIHVHVCVL